MKTNKSYGGAALRTLTVLAIVFLVAIIILFAVTKAVGTRKAKTKTTAGQESAAPVFVYDKTLGDIRFVFGSAINLGSVLKKPATASPYDKDTITTERFIMITVKAQNKGKVNMNQNSWDLGNIIDEESRNFVAIDGRQWLPEQNFCGAALKPEFEPTPCYRIYEVSKASKKLKIEVIAGDKKDTLDITLVGQ